MKFDHCHFLIVFKSRESPQVYGKPPEQSINWAPEVKTNVPNAFKLNHNLWITKLPIPRPWLYPESRFQDDSSIVWSFWRFHYAFAFPITFFVRINAFRDNSCALNVFVRVCYNCYMLKCFWSKLRTWRLTHPLFHKRSCFFLNNQWAAERSMFQEAGFDFGVLRMLRSRLVLIIYAYDHLRVSNVGADCCSSCDQYRGDIFWPKWLQTRKSKHEYRRRLFLTISVNSLTS